MLPAKEIGNFADIPKFMTLDNSSKTISRMLCMALLLMAGVLSGCNEDKSGAVAMVPEVQVAVVEQRDVPVYREWVGTLEGEVNATISAQVSGYLLTRNYNEGRFVTNGQASFRLTTALTRRFWIRRWPNWANPNST